MKSKKTNEKLSIRKSTIKKLKGLTVRSGIKAGSKLTWSNGKC